MAASTVIKIFNPSGEFIASCKYFEDAGVVAHANGPGSTVRMGHPKRDTFYTVSSDPDADHCDEFHLATEAMLEARRNA